jgi:hypothetical protein
MFQQFSITTPDGDGLATKAERNEAWHVMVPTMDFRWHGSVTQVKGEIHRRLEMTYAEKATFGETVAG